MKVRVYVSTNKVGSECSTEIEVEDDASEDAIEEAARDAMFNLIEWGWTRVTRTRRTP